MNPEAFQLGPLTIRWYGIFVAAAFLVGFLFAGRRARKRGISVDSISDLLFWTMVSGIVGARALYVIQEWKGQFAGGPLLEVVRIDHGGLVFFGGFLAGIGAVVLISRIRRLPLFTIGDVMAPVVPLGQAIGRIGCLLNGCCFGHPFQGFCAIRYGPDSAVGYVQQVKGVTGGGAVVLPVFPIQAVYSIANLAMVAVLLVVERRFNMRGRLFGLFMILYGSTRFVLEFGRGDYLHRVGPLTPAQVVCLLVVPLGVLIIWLGGRSGRGREEAA